MTRAIVVTSLIVAGVVSCTAASSGPRTEPTAADGGGAVRPKATRCEPGEDGVFVGQVSGRVLDTTGNPPTAHDVTVCGSACIRGKLNDDGTFAVTPSFCFRHGDFYPVPVFIFHGHPAYANVVVDFVPHDAKHLDTLAVEPIIYTVSTAGFAKATLDNAAPFALADATGFSLSAVAGAIALPYVEEPIVAAGPVDLAFFPLGKGKGGETLTALYAIVPDEAEIHPPATVRFPNAAKLAPGTPVELLAIGNLVTAKKPPPETLRPGTLGVIGTGRVSADGAFVESVPGTDTGLMTTGWIGYRPKL